MSFGIQAFALSSSSQFFPVPLSTLPLHDLLALPIPKALTATNYIYIVWLSPWINLSHCVKCTPSSVVSAKIFGRLSNNNVDYSTSISGCLPGTLYINSIVL